MFVSDSNVNSQDAGLSKLQAGTQEGATMAGNVAFGTTRPIMASEFVDHDLKPDKSGHQVI